MKKTKELLKLVTIEKMRKYVEEELGHSLESELAEDYSDSNNMAFSSMAFFICTMMNEIMEEEVCSGETIWDGCSEFYSIINIRVKGEPVLFLEFQFSTDSYKEAIDSIYEAIEAYVDDEAVFDTAIINEHRVLPLSIILRREVSIEETRKVQEFIDSQEFMKEVIELALRR